MIQDCKDLYTVNEKSIAYVFKELASQRQFFAPTTKLVWRDLVSLEMKDIPYEGTLSERIEFINTTVDSLIEEYLKLKKIKVINEEGKEEEPTYPEIEKVVITIKSGLKELNTNTKSNSVIGNITVIGGTKPYTYSFNGGKDDSKFILSGSSIITKEALTQGSYSISIKVKDFGDKEKEETATIKVAERDYPEIESLLINVTPNLKEFEENTKANSIVAEVSAKGGTEPYSFELTEGTETFTLEETQIKTNKDLSGGFHKFTVKVTDSKNKELTKTIQLQVAEYEFENIQIQVPDESMDLLGLKISDLGSYKVSGDMVTGNLNYVTNYTQFSKDLEEQSGNYLALYFPEISTMDKIKVEITDAQKKSSGELDKDGILIVRLTSTDQVIKITRVYKGKENTMSIKLNLKFEKPAPEITSVLVTPEKELREGEDNVKSGSKVATVEVVGGTEPFTITLEEDETSQKFELQDKEIKCTKDLTKGEYVLTVKVVDSRKKEKETTTTLKVLEKQYAEVVSPQQEIGDVTVSEIQENIEISENYEISGTSKYIENLEAWTKDENKSGNFLVLGIKENNQVESTCDFVNVPDTQDYIFKVTNPETDTVTVTPQAAVPVRRTKSKAIATIAAAGEPIVYTMKELILEKEATITSVTITPEENLKAPITVDTKVATLKAEGGTPDYEFTLEGGDDKDNFKIEGSEVKAAKELTVKTYKLKVKATDSKGKEKVSDEVDIVVEKGTVEVKVSEPGAGEDLFGKHTQDLQEGITGFDTKTLTGTSKYIRNYEGLPVVEDREGNFLALHFEQAGQGYTVKAGFEGGKETTLDPDGNYVVKLKEKKPIKVIVENEITKGEATIDISGIELEPAWTIYDISEVITPRDQEADTFDKKVKDLQLNNVKITKTEERKGKATGTIKWISEWSNPDIKEGNVIAIHIDNTKLPEGEVKFAIGGKEASPDKNDWNLNLRVDNKEDKDLQIKVDGEVLYTLNVSELTLLNKPEEVLKVLAANHSMGNKKVSDLQSDVTISKDKLTGTSKWIKGLTLTQGAKDPGNYLALHIEKSKLPSENITIGINSLTNIDKKDWDVLLIVTEESIQKPFRIAIDGEVVYNFDLKDIKLVREVLSPRDQNADTYNKKVSDLQEADVVVKEIDSTRGEAEGTLKYVTGWTENPTMQEGNVLALHIDNTKIPDGEVKLGIGDQFVDPDKNDWNINIRLDNKPDREFKIKVGEQIVYTLDLNKLELTPKAE